MPHAPYLDFFFLLPLAICIEINMLSVYLFILLLYRAIEAMPPRHLAEFTGTSQLYRPISGHTPIAVYNAKGLSRLMPLEFLTSSARLAFAHYLTTSSAGR